MEKPNYQFGDIVWGMWNNKPCRLVCISDKTFVPENEVAIKWLDSWISEWDGQTFFGNKQELLDSFKD